MSAITTRRTQAIGTGFWSLPTLAQGYIAIVVLCGLLVIMESVHELYSTKITSQWFLLAALTLLSGSITVKLPSIPATISVSETFVFTSVLLFGTAAGTITVTLDGLIISLWLQRRNLEFHKLLFNTTAPALSIWIAAQIFFLVTGASPLSITPVGITSLLPGVLLFALAYFLLNSWLMAAALSFEQPLSASQIWRQNFMWLSLNFFSGASVAILLVSMNREVNLSALAVIVPLLVISYLTYHTSMKRVEDANRHVEDLNHLYLSTIETLAMAIDAKDQVTHGHIRRVQSFSVGLAREIGVADQKVIKAIEAASLLHDMGKLAIPEHILNKPGKLSSAEFEIIKVHAAAGADILSAIEFPYPVIPIVRHHHENWDGNGYPDGLSGTDIPIGARILAVVDCFDALTSDRPYRPKLANSEALAILQDRRGNMYDPLIVDAFVQMQSRFPPTENSLTERSAALEARMAIAGRTKPPGKIPVSSAIVEHTPGTVEGSALPYSVEVLASYLTQMAPKSVLVLYMFDESACALKVARSWGPRPAFLTELRVPLGKGVSGWVAVMKQPVYNAVPALDFLSGHLVPTEDFVACASEPVVMDGQLLGVLTFYLPSIWRSTRSAERNLALTSAHLSTYLASVQRCTIA
jgi:putative nucleotidyltransferase with HDIG domain